MIRKLRTYFFTGILVVTPILLTVFIFWKLFKGLDSVVLNILNGLLVNFGFQAYYGKIPGLGVVVLVLGILLTGMIARNYLGKKLFKLGDWLVTQIPLISKIYIAIRQIFEAIFSEKREVFKQAVMFEYPRRGTYSVGFVTQDTRGEIQDKIDSDVLSVFVPTTPNPTSGYLIFVPKKDAIILDMTIEQALKLIISAGAISPDNDQKEEFSIEDFFPFKRKKTREKISNFFKRSSDQNK